MTRRITVELDLTEEELRLIATHCGQKMPIAGDLTIKGFIEEEVYQAIRELARR
jgi:hypothetical protein